MDMAREIAFMIDEDGTTNEELQAVLCELEERINAGEANTTMIDNYYTLKDAERELDYWEGTAREKEAQASPGRPAPVSVFFVIDDGRKGIAREQRVEAITETALGVIRSELREGDFVHVANVPDGSVTNGVSEIWFKPNPRDYILTRSHNEEVTDIINALIMRRDYREGARQ